MKSSSSLAGCHMSASPTPLILGRGEGEERTMDEVELRRQLECAHSDSLAWALACCGRDGNTAQEVLQTVYLAVLEGHAHFAGRSRFGTWFFGVIRRTAASERRRRWARELLLARGADRIPFRRAGNGGHRPQVPRAGGSPPQGI